MLSTRKLDATNNNNKNYAGFIEAEHSRMKVFKLERIWTLSRACNTTVFIFRMFQWSCVVVFFFILSHSPSRPFFICFFRLFRCLALNNVNGKVTTAHEAISKSDETALHIHCFEYWFLFKSWSLFACDTIVDDKDTLLNQLNRSKYVWDISPCIGSVFIFVRRLLFLFRTSFNDVFVYCQLALCFYSMGFRYYFAFIVYSFFPLPSPKKHSGSRFRFLLSADVFRSIKTWIVSSFIFFFFFFFFAVIFCSFRFCLFKLLLLLNVLVFVWRMLIILCLPIRSVTMAERFVSADVN